MRSYLPLIKSEWRLIAFGFLMMFVSSPGQTFFIGLFGAQIRADFQISHGQFGALYSAATLSSAFLLLWTGPIIDRVELKKVAFAVVICLAAAMVLLSQSSAVALLFLAILALRQFGQGLISMTASTAMMRYIEKGRGKANSLMSIGYSASEAVMPAVIIMLLGFLAWRQVWLLLAMVIVVVMPIAIQLLLRRHNDRHQRYLDQQNTAPSVPHGTANSSTLNDAALVHRQWTRSEVVRDPFFYLLIPALLSQSMLYTGFMFHQMQLIAEKQWPLSLWAGLIALFSVVSISTSLTVGALIDRIGAQKFAPLVTVPMGLGLLILANFDSSSAAVIFMICMALSTGSQAATTAPFFAERYGNRHFASIKSLGTFVMVFLSALSPALMGWLIDAGWSIDELAFAGAVYVVLIVGMALFANRRAAARAELSQA